MSLLLISPVPSRQRIFQTISDDPRLDCQLQVKIFATVNELLSVQTNLLRQVPKQPGVVMNIHISLVTAGLVAWCNIMCCVQSMKLQFISVAFLHTFNKWNRLCVNLRK